MHKRDKQELLAAIEADKESHIAFLQAFIQAPSPNPPGDTTQAAKVLRTYLHSRGITTQTLGPKPHLPNLVSDFTSHLGSGPRVVMNGHMDVFPVSASDGDKWTHGPLVGPWSGFNDGTHILGRGAVDMKAGTAASCIAYSYLHERRKHLKGNLALTAVSDEETGGK
jgi:succinyl-diaminopimelate desuccinylase